MKYRVYHGTGALFDQFKIENARLKNDHFGGLLYFTDNKSIALQYAAAEAKKAHSSQKVIYTVELDIKNLFDVKQTYTGKQLLKLLKNVNIEDFARKAGLLRYGSDKYQIIAELKSGNMTMTGEQIFLGLSNGQRDTSRTRDILKRAGFDGLKYYGAKIFGVNPHTVYLPYDANSIKIVNINLE